MSEDPKPAEIEDVLSSIRRLVQGGGSEASGRDRSEETVPGAVPAEADKEEGTAEETPPQREEDPGLAPASALVLTPALRIGEDARDAEPEAGQAGAVAGDAVPDAGPAETDDGPDPAPASQAAADEDHGPAGESEPGADLPESGDALDEQPDPSGPARKSPFLPEGLRARAGPDQPTPPAAAREEVPSAARQGFGFGMSRREDPVRHVPLGPVPDRPAEGGDGDAETGARPVGEGEAAGPGGAAHADGDVPTGGEGPEPDGGIGPRADGADPAAEAPEAETAPDRPGDPIPSDSGEDPQALAPRGPIISPDFARRSSPVSPTSPGAEPSADGGDPPGAASNAAAPEVPGEAPPEMPQAERQDAAADTPTLGPAPDDERRTETVVPGSENPASQPSAAPGSAGPPVGQSEHEDADEVDVSAEDRTEPLPVDRIDGESDAATAPYNLFGDAESGIDEEALRDMVAEVVQQELQGALGERVSRNIRALVRREIARALEERNLD